MVIADAGVHIWRPEAPTGAGCPAAGRIAGGADLREFGVHRGRLACRGAVKSWLDRLRTNGVGPHRFLCRFVPSKFSLGFIIGGDCL